MEKNWKRNYLSIVKDQCKWWIRISPNIVLHFSANYSISKIIITTSCHFLHFFNRLEHHVNCRLYSFIKKNNFKIIHLKCSLEIPWRKYDRIYVPVPSGKAPSGKLILEYPGNGWNVFILSGKLKPSLFDKFITTEAKTKWEKN